jgi:hypothetical protein
MRFADLLRQLPNGLHDASLRAVTVDIVARRIVMELDVSVGTPDDVPAERDRYAAGVLTLSGIRWFRFDATMIADIGVAGARMDAGEVSELQMRPELPLVAPSESPCWFFLADSNSFLYCIASDVNFEFSQR